MNTLSVSLKHFEDYEQVWHYQKKKYVCSSVLVPGIFQRKEIFLDIYCKGVHQ